MTRLPDGVAALAGWRRHGLAFLLGCLATLSLAPLYAVPVLLVSFTVLVWLVDGARTRRAAFFTGWWFGFGFHVIGLYWVSAALFVDPAKFAWYLPITATGLPAVLAFFCGVATWAMRRWGGLGTARLLLLVAVWAAMDWVRGHVFTGFPWNLAAYAWVGHAPMMQTAALVGAYGLSLVTVLAAVAPAAVWRPTGFGDRSGRAVLALAVLLIGAGWGWGAYVLAQPQPEDVPGVRLRLVQPSIPQSLKWDRDARIEILRRLLALSGSEGHDKVTHMLWAETAVPFPLADDPEARKAVASIIPPGGLLLTGASRYAWAEDGSLAQAWNGFVAIDGDAEVVGSYDKFHLVPLGEYLPLRSVLGRIGMSKITAGTIDFTAGPGPQTLHLPGLPPVGPLICYEAIFPGEVVDRADRPAWLLNVTNDAWFGRTAGPHQHLAIAAMRAVEEGIPLVRVANDGISAVVDAHGRVIASLGLEQIGVLDSTLPAPLPGGTIYATLGDLPFFLMVGLTLLGAGLLRRRNRSGPAVSRRGRA